MPAPRWIYLASGHACLGVALAGIVLPIPSTPFLVAAAACYLRGSEARHRWLVEHPVMGPMLREVAAPQGPSPRARIALCMAAVLSAVSIGWRADAVHRPWLAGVLGAFIAAGCALALSWGRRGARS